MGLVARCKPVHRSSSQRRAFDYHLILVDLHHITLFAMQGSGRRFECCETDRSGPLHLCSSCCANLGHNPQVILNRERLLLRDTWNPMRSLNTGREDQVDLRQPIWGRPPRNQFVTLPGGKGQFFLAFVSFFQGFKGGGHCPTGAEKTNI